MLIRMRSIERRRGRSGPSRWSVGVTAVATWALVAAGTPADAMTAPTTKQVAAISAPAPEVRTPSTPVQGVAASTKDETPQESPRKVVWPEASRSQVVARTSARVDVPGTGISLSARSGAEDGASWTVETGGHDVAHRLGGVGQAFVVTGTGAAATADVVLDFSSFADAFGGGFATRLQLVQLPVCAWVAAQAGSEIPPGCDARGTTLPSTIDLVNHTLKSQIQVGTSATSEGSAPEQGLTSGTEPSPVPGTSAPAAALPVATSSGSAYVVQAGATGQEGTYRATSTTMAGSWAVGASSGAFTHSLPLPSAPSEVGTSPTLQLSYNSGSVDGMTSGDNPQASDVGLGWGLHTPYIERQYNACADDGHSGMADLCWAGEHYVISLNGHSSKLVRDTTQSEEVFRLQDDPGWVVRKLKDEELRNGDNTGEYWRVDSTTGERFYFGRGYVERLTATGTAQEEETNSVLTVPVYGDDSGEPCHDSTLSSSWCRQAWRWNLDFYVSTNEVSNVYLYDKETNYYNRNGGTRTIYDRASRLYRVEYSIPLIPSSQVSPAKDDVIGAPTSKTSFFYASRCKEIATGAPIPDSPDCPSVTAANASSYYDIPIDLMCSSSSCSQDAPTFFSTKLLYKVTSYRTPGTSINDIDEVRLGYTFPSNTDGTDPSLWLKRVARTGLAGTEVEKSLPVITIHGTLLDNRVDYNLSAGVVQLKKYRLTRVENEFGGDVEVTYGQPPGDTCTVANLPSQWDTNEKACFPRFWVPEAGPVGFGAFHKYVTLSVAEHNPFPATSTAKAAASQDTLTTYSYVGDAGWLKPIDPPGSTATVAYNDWRGYGTIRTERRADLAYSGNNDRLALSEETYFRGMHAKPMVGGVTKTYDVVTSDGTTVEDYYHLAGRLREHRDFVYRGSDSGWVEESASWHSVGTVRTTPFGGSGVDDMRDARIVREKITKYRQRVVSSAGTVSSRESRVDTTYSDLGQPLTVVTSSAGLVGTCTQTEYSVDSYSLDRNIIDFPTHVTTREASCASTSRILADTVTYYDGATTATSQKVYDGNPTKVVTATTATADGRAVATRQTVSTATYNAHGRLTSSSDGLGNTTTTTYSELGLAQPTVTITNAKDQSSSVEMDRYRLVPETTTDPNGNAVTQAYDPLGRLIRVALPGESATTASYTFAYDIDAARSRSAKITSSRRQADGSYTSVYSFLDALARPIQTQTLAPSSPASGQLVTQVVNTRYDALGRPVAVSLPILTAATPGAALRNFDLTAIHEQQTAYDNLGRPTVSKLMNNNAEKWRSSTTYKQSSIVVTPPSGGVATVETIDAFGRATSRTEGSGSTQATTSYKYDPAGRVTQITDAGGAASTTVYDLRGRAVRVTDPDAGTSTTTYDAAGNVDTVTRADGSQLKTTYDSLNRPLTTQGRTGSSASWSTLVSRAYDSSTNGVGMIASTTTFDGSQAYVSAITAYTTHGLPTAAATTIPAIGGLSASKTYTTSMTYNSADALRTLTYPAAGGLPQETVTAGYNSVGLASTLTGASPYVTQTTYFGEGGVASRTFGATPTPITRTYSLESGTQRLSGVTTKAGSTTVQADTLSYNDAGNLTSLVDTLTGTRTCNTFDALNRLKHSWTTSASGCTDSDSTTAAGPAGYNQSWTHAASGNIATARKGSSTSAYSYGDAAHPHAVTSVGTSTYAYDALGRQTSRTVAGETTTLTWDLLGNLKSATKASSVTRFVHAADGSRLARIGPDGTATAYIGAQEVDIANGVETTARRYYTSGGTTSAVRTPTGLTWQVNDRQGSVDLQVDAATGAVRRTYTDPFGMPRAGSASPITDRGWLGKTRDPSTGLTHLGARYYDPALGRFLAPDPLNVQVSTQSPNAYSYSSNNPVMFSDPTGLAQMCGSGGINCDAPRRAPIDDNLNSRGIARKTVAGTTGNGSTTVTQIVGTTKMTLRAALFPVILRKAMQETGVSDAGLALSCNLATVDSPDCAGAMGLFFEADQIALHMCAHPGVACSGGTAWDVIALGAIHVGAGNGRLGGGTGYVAVPGGKPLPGAGVGETAANTARTAISGSRVVSGRFPRTAGPDDILVRRGSGGEVTNYQVYGPDGLPLKRVDVTGRSHRGVDTPHVVEFEQHVNPTTGEVFVRPGSTVRPATPEELMGLD